MPIELMYKILLQVPAITSGGSISAEWVLVGITTAAIFLFWRMLWKIETGLDKVMISVQTHNTQLQLQEKSIEDLEETIRELKNKRKS